MAEPLVFSQSFEALLRALGARGGVTTENKARFREIGVDYDGRLLPAYPLAVWVKPMELGSELVSPGAPQERRHFELGRLMVDSYGETLVGRALLAVMRVIGPRRTIERMTRNLRTTNNYTESSLEPMPDGRTKVWCSRVVSPAFYRGMFTRTVEAAGGKDVKVEVLSADATGAAFAVEWQ